MNSKVEKKRAFLIDLLYAVAIMALIYVFFKYCFAVAAPFLLSFFLQLFCKGLSDGLIKRLKINIMHFGQFCWYFYALQLF